MALVKVTWNIGDAQSYSEGFKIFRNGTLIETINDKNIGEYYDDITTLVDNGSTKDELTFRYTVRSFTGTELSEEYITSSHYIGAYTVKYFGLNSNEYVYDYEVSNGIYRYDGNSSSVNKAQGSGNAWRVISSYWSNYGNIEITNDGAAYLKLNLWSDTLSEIGIVGLRVDRTSETSGFNITYKVYGFNNADKSDRIELATDYTDNPVAPKGRYTHLFFDSEKNYKGYEVESSIIGSAGNHVRVCTFIAAITKIK